MVIVKLTVMEMAYQTLTLVHSLLLYIAMYVRTYVHIFTSALFTVG